MASAIAVDQRTDVTGVGLCLPQLGPHASAEAVRDFAVRADELGYSSLWVQDHFMWPLEPARGYRGRPGPIPEQYKSVLAPTETLAAVAAWTTRTRIGTSVLVAGNHWPVPLAQRLATLDQLSRGRLVAGFGVGWQAEEHEAAGSDVSTRGRRFDAFMPAMLACWADDPVTHDGPIFRIPPSVIRPKPLQQPRPPLLSGMWSPVGLERTRIAFDGWNPAGLPVDRVVETASALNADRPEGMEPLTVHVRLFAQWPGQAANEPGQPVLDRLCADTAAARDHGLEEVIIEHNFWDEIRSPADWVAIPDRFVPVLEAASG